MSETKEGGTKKPSSTDLNSLSSYNVIGHLSGLGRAIFMHVVHEMDDVRDIPVFLSLCRCMHDIRLDDLFSWSIAPSLSAVYGISSVPVDLTDLVCYFCCVNTSLFWEHLSFLSGWICKLLFGSCWICKSRLDSDSPRCVIHYCLQFDIFLVPLLFLPCCSFMGLFFFP